MPALARVIRLLALLGLLAMLSSPPGWAIALAGAAIGAIALRDLRAVARARKVGAVPTAEPALVLGTARDGGPVALSDSQMSAHALILGASGAGKSTTLLRLLGEQVRMGRPVVALDMKGSSAFAGALAAAAGAVGRPLWVFTPDGPARWNPLAHGNATELKDKLVATERFTEPHYRRAAERYVQAVLQVLERTHPGTPPTLREVVELMDPRRLPVLLRRTPRELAERIQDYISSLTPDQLSAIRGLGTRLAVITESHTGAFLTPEPDAQSIDLRRALCGDSVVLFSLNSSMYGSLSAQLGALAIQDLVAATGHRLGDPARLADGGRAAPALVAIDEFSALGADNLISLLARSREAGVSVILATQELADLDRAAPGLKDQVLGSTAIKIAHRQDVPSSARTIAQMAGTETVWERSEQIARHPLYGTRLTGGATRRRAERFAVHPNEIAALEPGEAVLITKLPRAEVRIVRVMAPAGRRPAVARTAAPRTSAATRRYPAPGVTR